MVRLALVLVLVTVGSAASAQTVKNRTVVVPTGEGTFAVKTGDIVRITGRGIAGARIAARVEGPGKLVAINSVAQLKNGKSLLGSSVREFEVEATGKGEVTVLVSVTGPQPESEPKVTVTRFTVK